MISSLRLSVYRVAAGLVVLHLSAAAAAQQAPSNEKSTGNGYFYQPSLTAAVGRAIRRQTLELKAKERRDEQTQGADERSPSLRREASSEGVIELTNRRQRSRGKGVVATNGDPGAALQGELEMGLDIPPATPLKHLDMKKLLEESALPLRAATSRSQLGRSRNRPPEDLGLDIALAALVAVGAAFLGIALWQRGQRSEE